MRRWKDVDRGGFDEHWRIEDPHGHVIYVGAPRTVLADDDELGDEVQGVRFDDADSTCVLVLEIDGREVARTDVEVAVAGGDTVTVPRTAGADTTRPEGAGGT